MKYFKNTELAKLYHVSEKSVRNWIEAAQSGKLDLELHNSGGRYSIANTAANNFKIEELAQRGKKYKNSRGFKTVEPRTEFYKHFKDREIFNLISNLDIHKEIPHKYCYFADGAKAWDEYIRKLAKEPFANSLSNSIELLGSSLEYIDSITSSYTGVNIVDIGVGNSMPVRDLLRHFVENGKMRRYIALDASRDMLDIAQDNIRQWFGDRVDFEGHIRDIGYDRFDELLIGDTFSENEQQKVINLVLFLGGTLVNLRDPDLAFRMISHSMGKNDLCIMSRKMDTEQARRFFDFSGSKSKNIRLVEQEAVVLDLLGIDESMYTVEQSFDSIKRQRITRIRLNVELSIRFVLGGKSRVVYLNKGDTILIWRAQHNTLIEMAAQLDRNGFDILQLSRSKDHQYVQFISQVTASTGSPEAS